MSKWRIHVRREMHNKQQQQNKYFNYNKRLLKTIDHETVLFYYGIFISAKKKVIVVAPSHILSWFFFSDFFSGFFCFHFCKCFFDLSRVVDSFYPYDRDYGMQLQLFHRSDKVKDLLFWTEFSVGKINDVNKKEEMYMYAGLIFMVDKFSWIV